MSLSSLNGYELVAIAQFCQTGSGGTPARSKPEYFGGGIAWVKSGELRETVITKSEETITEAGLRDSAAKLLPKDTLLVALYGATVGRIGVLGVEATTNQAVCYIIPDKRKADGRYLFYALRSQVPFWLGKRVGGGQPNISQGIIKDTRIPLPPLSEQRRIADILDKADAIRRKRRQLRESTRGMILSIFHHDFGQPITNPRKWSVLPLAEVVAEGTGVTYGIVQCGPHVENGVPYFRTSDITGERTPSLDEFGRTAPEIAARFERSTVRTGELVLAIRASVGAIVEVPAELDGANLTQGTARIAPGAKTTKEYLLWCLRTPQMQDWLQRQCKGATFREITLSRLREMPVPVPPMEIQRRFSAQVAKTVRIGDRFSDAANASSKLFDSLVQRAFRGEL